MKNLLAIVMAAALCLTAVSAEAKRMGAGKSVGQQSTNVSKQAAPAKKAPDATSTTAPAAAPAAAPSRPWGAMLGGLAAGLGLAWLASSLGLGAAFGNILMALLIGVALLAAVGWFMRSKKSNTSDLSLQGAGASPQNPAALRQYNPQDLGNEAAVPTQYSGSIIGSALSDNGAGTWTIPEGFDTDNFLAVAKRNYLIMQSAWDAADIVTLQSMMTDALFLEIRKQLTERGTEINTTKVTTLDVVLLGIEDQPDHYMASVKFSGWVQEDASGVQEFAEVWNMAKNKQNGNWLIAGIQAV